MYNTGYLYYCCLNQIFSEAISAVHCMFMNLYGQEFTGQKHKYHTSAHMQFIVK